MPSIRSLQSKTSLLALRNTVASAARAGISALYPPQCLLCGELVQTEGGLCGRCWVDTPFCHGLQCFLCGLPLPGEALGLDVACDDCRSLRRPWAAGQSVMLYDGGARRLVMGLKHGDRLDLVPSLAAWMAAKAAPLITANTILAPVPAHWRRLFKRRYNQAAVLAREMSPLLECPVLPDLLLRQKATTPQDKKSIDARFADLEGAFAVNPRHAGHLPGRDVLLVDDVMTSGATLDGCTRVALQAGAVNVRVIVLARVSKNA